MCVLGVGEINAASTVSGASACLFDLVYEALELPADIYSQRSEEAGKAALDGYVLPLGDRTAERLNPDLAGRPQARARYLAGAVRRDGPPIGVQRAEHQEQVVHDHRRDRRRRHPGNGKASFVYNLLGIQQFATEAQQTIPQGTHQVRMEFAYDGGGLAKGGAVTLYYDGEQLATGRVAATQPFIFSADETTDIGYDAGTPVSADAPTGKFTGTIKWVQIDLGTDAHDHLGDPHHAMHVAMSLQ